MKSVLVCRSFLWTLTGLLACPPFIPTAAAQRSYGGWGMGSGMMIGWSGGWLMIAFWVLILLGLVLLIKWLVQMTRADREGFSRPSAMEILKERYARGEIDHLEFAAKKKDLLD